mgnify:CR=1 FL=1|jgi:hypothetical protein
MVELDMSSFLRQSNGSEPAAAGSHRELFGEFVPLGCSSSRARLPTFAARRSGRQIPPFLIKVGGERGRIED